MDVHTEAMLRFVTSLSCLLLLGASLRSKAGSASGKLEGRSKVLLTTAAGLALLCFYNFGFVRHFQGTGFVNYHEHHPYYLGAKYFPELGYDGLYAASLAAILERDPQAALPPTVRDLRTNRLVPTRTYIAAARLAPARFTPERWQQFASDHARIWDSASEGVRRAVLNDHGFNPTPTFAAIARPLISPIAPGSPGSLILSFIDIVLVALMSVVVGRTYGARVLCTSLVVLGLGFGWRYIYVGALMRLDWLFAVVSAFCLLERRKPAMAGALLGYAATVRLFPVLFLAGPAVLALKAWWQGERPGWPVRLFGAFAMTAALGVVIGALLGRGFEGWIEFADNIAKHQTITPPTRLGLNAALRTDPWELAGALATLTPIPTATLLRNDAERQLALLGLQVAFVALFCLAAWRAALVESAILGLGLIFVLAPAGSYYWVMLLTLPFLQGPGRMERFAPLLPVVFAAFMYGHEVRSGVQAMVHERFLALSWGMTLFFATWLGWRASRTLAAEPASRPVDA